METARGSERRAWDDGQLQEQYGVEAWNSRRKEDKSIRGIESPPIQSMISRMELISPYRIGEDAGN
jgi:hypothetical protein